MDSLGIIERLGGYRGLAGSLDENPAVVHHWIRRGIPARVWPRVLKLAQAKGVADITIEALAEAAPGVPRRPRRRGGAGDAPAAAA